MKHLSVHLLSFLLFFSISIMDANAQEDNKNKRLQIVYIDHEVTTPTDALNQRMTERFYKVREFPDYEAMVIYLSNGRKSPMAFVNLKEYWTENQLRIFTTSGLSRDTDDAFKDVLEQLNNANSHTVDARADINNILDLLENLQVFNDNGALNFKSIRFDFYVGPNFWLLRNNEKVIARLYSVIHQGLTDTEWKKIEFHVLKAPNMNLEHPAGQPFGASNLDGINKELEIMEY